MISSKKDIDLFPDKTTQISFAIPKFEAANKTSWTKN